MLWNGPGGLYKRIVFIVRFTLCCGQVKGCTIQAMKEINSVKQEPFSINIIIISCPSTSFIVTLNAFGDL